MDQKLKQDINIGKNIRALRRKNKWTQEQVTAKLQIHGIIMSRDFYSHIECGDYNIRISELAALRRIFDCEYNDFFQDI